MRILIEPNIARDADECCPRAPAALARHAVAFVAVTVSRFFYLVVEHFDQQFVWLPRRVLCNELLQFCLQLLELVESIINLGPYAALFGSHGFDSFAPKLAADGLYHAQHSSVPVAIFTVAYHTTEVTAGKGFGLGITSQAFSFDILALSCTTPARSFRSTTAR